jgi:hypothetical protein
LEYECLHPRKLDFDVFGNVFDARVPRGGQGRTFGVREAAKIVFDYQRPRFARTSAQAVGQ